MPQPMMFPPSQRQYVFSDQPDGPGHHSDLVKVLAAIYDPFTRRQLDPLLTAGMTCLEIGAGYGSVAKFMSTYDATVLATDVDQDRLDHLAQVAAGVEHMTVLRHDVATDPLEPLGRFDLIHARLVFGHLPDRQQVVAKLVQALTPGGRLVIEEFSASWDRCVMNVPPGWDRDDTAPGGRSAYGLFLDYHDALTAVLADSGTDIRWGLQAAGVMEQAGLVDVTGKVEADVWRGGEAGCRLPYLAAEQLRERLVAAGMGEDSIDSFRGLLRDPQLRIHGNLMVSTIGSRP